MEDISDVKSAKKVMESGWQEFARTFTSTMDRTLKDVNVKNNNLSYANDQLRRELFSMKQVISQLERKLETAENDLEQLSGRPGDRGELEAAYARVASLEKQCDEQSDLVTQAHANLEQFAASVSASRRDNLALAAENQELKAMAVPQREETEALRAEMREMNVQIARYQVKLAESCSPGIDQKENVTRPLLTDVKPIRPSSPKPSKTELKLQQELQLLQQNYDSLLAAKEKVTEKYQQDMLRWRKFKDWLTTSDGTPLKRSAKKRKRLFGDLGPELPAHLSPTKVTKCQNEGEKGELPSSPIYELDSSPTAQLPQHHTRPRLLTKNPGQDSPTQEESAPWIPEPTLAVRKLESTPKSKRKIILEVTPPPNRNSSTVSAKLPPSSAPPRNGGLDQSAQVSKEETSLNHASTSTHIPPIALDHSTKRHPHSSPLQEPQRTLPQSAKRSCPPESPSKRNEIVDEEPDCGPSSPKRLKITSRSKEEQAEYLRTLNNMSKAEYVAEYAGYKGRGRYAPSSNKKALPTINTEFEINPDRNDGLTHQFDEVVRNKTARKQLEGTDCECCKDYYDAVGRMPPKPQAPLWRSPSSSQDMSSGRVCRKYLDKQEEHEAELAAHKKDISRHRHQWAVTSTPPGYWNIGFPTTQEVEDINDKAVEMQVKKRQQIETEASKKDGKYRKR